MAWVRIDTGFADHPKLLQLTLAQRWIHVQAMCWAAGHGTGGLIPGYALQRIGATPKIARRMEEVGLWDPDPEGWRIHDWRIYNVDAEASKEARDESMVRRAQWREQKRRQRKKDADISGGHEVDSPPDNGQDSPPDVLPSRRRARSTVRPDPTRPDPRPCRDGSESGARGELEPPAPAPSPGAPAPAAVGGGANGAAVVPISEAAAHDPVLARLLPPRPP